MGDLEEKGYIIQPYTSAGRVPTDVGYRYYIDHLVAVERSSAMQEQLEPHLTFTSPNVSTLVTEFSRRLGVITNSIGFVMTASQDTTTVKHIEFTRLRQGGAVLAILVTKDGMVKNVLLNIPADVPDAHLHYMGAYLTEQLSQMSISQLRAKLAQDYANSMGALHATLETLISIENVVFSEEMFERFFVLEGASNMVDCPEFHDTQRLRAILRTIEEKKGIADVLERIINNKGVQIFVGSEIGLGDIDELGLVTSTYEKKGNVVGMLGVIGPKRMEYSRVIPVVGYSSHLLTQLLNQLYGGYSDD
jgi:heat-inducible transcriptional repressor